MLVYSITIKVDAALRERWLRWQREEHIPEIMATGLFDEYKIFRLLEQEDPDGDTFVIQYFTTTRERYEEYIRQHARCLRDRSLQAWGAGIIAFRSLLESVQ